MSTEFWGREFPEQNLASKYPFGDAATLVTSDGMPFGADVIVDALVHLVEPVARPSLTAVESTLDGVVLWVGDEDNDRAASCRIDPRTTPASAPLTDRMGRPAGVLVLNPPAATALQTWPAGVHEFAAGAAEFAAAVLVPSPEPGLRGLQDASGVLLTGDVWIIGGDGVLAGFVEPDLASLNAVGDPLYKRRACLDSGPFTPPNFLKSINGVGPDARGGFMLAPAGVAKGRTVLHIDPSGTDALVISLSGPTS